VVRDAQEGSYSLTRWARRWATFMFLTHRIEVFEIETVPKANSNGGQWNGNSPQRNRNAHGVCVDPYERQPTQRRVLVMRRIVAWQIQLHERGCKLRLNAMII
jgi:hypothetical protein